MDTNLFRYIWRHSRREQLFVLALILASLPFYWLSLDIPKRIVNEALQGRAFQNGVTEAKLFELSLPLPDWLGGTIVISEGFAFEQLGYLFALSFLFLFFVLANGAFKFGINISKGILAERMLRRLRFELFARLMRFRPEQIRAVKPAEAASMIKDEVEPIGGFIGDAFIQPAFLGTQALTALLFIMAQSVWLGSVALAIVLVQAFVIPYLRREQIRLGRARQIASRKLAGRIGEMIDGAGMIHAHGLKTYSEAEIGSRLGKLFDIRAALFRRKFAVKYLNNLLAQITPFFFYSIGGYLALRGTLDIGQLVAVIAAYRDLPPPIKELIDWEQQRADVTVKYEQVIAQFSQQSLVPDDPDADVTVPAPDSLIRAKGIVVNDQRGAPLLTLATLEIPQPSHVGLIGTASSGRDILARILGRQLSEYEGEVTIGDQRLLDLSDTAAAAVIAYVPPDPELFAGSIRDNVLVSLRRRPPPVENPTLPRWREARRAGNPLLDDESDWFDYEAACVATTAELDKRAIQILKSVGMGPDLYSYGLDGPIRRACDQELGFRVVEARHELHDRLQRAGLDSLVAPFEFTAFNRQATLGENLAFGVIAGERLAGTGRASDPYFRSIISAKSLEQPLLAIGAAIAENSVEVFAGLPPDHPLFDRFSMIKATELEEFAELVEVYRGKGADFLLNETGRSRLLALALDYIEPRHRLGLLTLDLERRILRARDSFRRFLPQDYAEEIEFYDPDAVMLAAPMRDNLLFGRVAQNVANADKRVSEFLKAALPDLGLEDLVYAIGLDYEVGPRGRALFAQQRAAVSLARSLIRNPQILVIEDDMKAFEHEAGKSAQDAIRRDMAQRTLIVTCEADAAHAEDFDVMVTFEGPRARVAAGSRKRASHESVESTGAGPDDPALATEERP